MRRKATRIFLANILASTTTLSATAICFPAYAQEQSIDFDIPSQDLGTALRIFAHAAREQITFDSAIVAGKRSQTLRGNFTAQQALDAMLRGSGLAAHRGRSGLFIVRPIEVGSGNDAAAPTDAAADGLEDIVVTARRQKESAQNVPIALTSTSGNSLRQAQTTRIEDLNQFSPSLNIVMPTPGNTSFSIRGVGANPGSLGLSTSVATFIDGVYMGKQGMSAVDLIDIQQIDVLRGPQGTLFGKNTTLGAIDIKTEQPRFAWAGSAQAAVGNLGYHQLQGSLTGPLSDAVAFRVTGYATKRDGFVHQLGTNHDMGGIDRWGVRGQLLIQPTDRLSIRIIGDYNREADDANAPVLVSYGGTAAAYRAKLAAIGATVAISPDGSETASDQVSTLRSKNMGASAEINWRIDDDLTLTSVSAWRLWRYFTDGDVDATSLDIAKVTTAYVRNRQLTQEIRLATSPSKPLSFVAGAYYYNSDAIQDSRVNYNAYAASFLTGIPNAQLADAAAHSPAVAAILPYNQSQWDTWVTPRIQSYALFGQGVWHITPRLNLTAGVRETYEVEKMAVWRPNPTSQVTGAPIAALASNVYPRTNLKVDDWSPSWLGSLDYAFTPKVRGYVQVSRGVKAGGINSALPSALGPDSLIVRPEVATNYEIGLKSRFWADRVQFNISLFRMDIADYQATYQAVVPATSAIVTLITNVGAVRTQGVEVDTSAAPVRGLMLRVNGSYNDAIYKSYPDGPCPAEVQGKSICDLSGRPVPQAPKWIVNASVDYRTSLGGGVTGVLGGNFAWQSSRYGYVDDSELTRINDTGLLGAHMGIELDEGRYELSVWGKNLLNVRQPTSFLSLGAFLPANYAAFFNEPRTYGLRVRVSF